MAYIVYSCVLLIYKQCMPIHAPVLLLLSEVAEVMLVDDLIIATLGRALGGFEDIFSSAAPGKFFSSKNR